MSQLHLTEYKAITLPREAMPYLIGEELDRRYGQYVDVTFPSPRTNGRWQLMALGWVGHLPLSDGWQLTIHTKVPTKNLWELLTWAYDWHSWRLFDGDIQSETLEAFYDGLARILAEQILLLARRGLFGRYEPQINRLPVVRGRLQLSPMLKNPVQVEPICAYEQYTIDNIYNQILALTLHHIGRSGWCQPDTLRLIHRARQAVPIQSPSHHIDWSILTYTRLNEPYRRLHVLCKFFLDGLLPHLNYGLSDAVPFLINMSRLYEQFVAAWLTARLPTTYRLRAQERVTVDEKNGRQIAIDIVIYNRLGQATAVLDTKYKAPDHPDMADIYQVAFYAHQQDCAHAYLVYPADLPQSIIGRNRDVTYRNITFALDGDIEVNGRKFLEQVLADG